MNPSLQVHASLDFWLFNVQTSSIMQALRARAHVLASLFMATLEEDAIPFVDCRYAGSRPANA